MSHETILKLLDQYTLKNAPKKLIYPEIEPTILPIIKEVFLLLSIKSNYECTINGNTISDNISITHRYLYDESSLYICLHVLEGRLITLDIRYRLDTRRDLRVNISLHELIKLGEAEGLFTLLYKTQEIYSGSVM